MGSSGSSDFKPSGTAPAPPAGSIIPPGGTAPHDPHFINFLGDTNVPSTGLTPVMLAAIDAMNNPQPRAPPPVAAAAAPLPPTAAPRDKLAEQMRRNGGEGGAGHTGAGSGGNSGGWGGH